MCDTARFLMSLRLRHTYLCLLFQSLTLVGCASRATRQGETTMPSPDGCFIQVWDAPRHAGITDYINGPRAWMNLRDLPGGRVWTNRIRSMKTGVRTRATVYAGENFSGPSMRLVADRDCDYPVLVDGMSGRIASMTIDCMQTAPAKAE
jgi:hypothetical protein